LSNKSIADELQISDQTVKFPDVAAVCAKLSAVNRTDTPLQRALSATSSPAHQPRVSRRGITSYLILGGQMEVEPAQPVRHGSPFPVARDDVRGDDRRWASRHASGSTTHLTAPRTPAHPVSAGSGRTAAASEKPRQRALMRQFDGKLGQRTGATSAQP
jgi:hypothetical protein